MDYATHPNQFSINDRAANYGDGVFTTMAVDQGRVALFRRHLDRLQHDSAKLGISFDAEALAAQIRSHATDMQHGVLKVLLSAGEGGRGYARSAQCSSGIFITRHMLPEHYNQWRQSGIQVDVSSLKLARQPALAGLKHLNRLEQVLIKRELANSTAQDAIVCDQQGCVVETSAANLFWLRDGIWYTPELSDCGVAGVMRGFLLDWFANSGVTVEVGRYSLSQLGQAQAVMLCNALMQIVPVTGMGGAAEQTFDPEPVRQLANNVITSYQEEYDQLD
ncbi:aminodeoxychorismate lyase [Alteromonas aestuariivivens]|uniref:Aminodeoxychorismate lyase n=1 Tax=Alteromonas aestuariivivens TaxID=1938339 RepID=A0A3D8MBB0_9ALTE|nr:aminodeoxychorismate lyase [Alteromonas aestuariivivens]RDV27421.1 aminodeoxychorismate lyase [Alteromonas aestuariivivens]